MTASHSSPNDLRQDSGIAEDPGNGLSFGEDRCNLVAQALLAASRERKLDRGSKLTTIAATFRNRGLDARRPYLSAGSSDPYSLRSSIQASRPRQPASQAARSRGAAVHQPAWRAQHLTAATSLLAGAIAVGDALCATACWDPSRRRCNWVGRSNNGTRLTAEIITPGTNALSWDLYGGLSGVALFLAELFAQTGIGSFRRTALSAIRCANEQVEPRFT